MTAPVATPAAALTGIGGAEDPRALSATQRVAMRAVANAGAGHAAAALSQITGGPVLLTVSAVRVDPFAFVRDELAAAGDEQLAVVRVDVSGGLAARTALVLPKRTAMRVAERLLRRPHGSAVALGALERSAVMEAGNIVCGAFVHALGDGMGLALVPSTPSLAVDGPRAVLAGDAAPAPDDWVVAVDARLSLHDVGERLRGHVLLAPAPAALAAILRSARAG